MKLFTCCCFKGGHLFTAAWARFIFFFKINNQIRVSHERLPALRAPWRIGNSPDGRIWLNSENKSWKTGKDVPQMPKSAVIVGIIVARITLTCQRYIISPAKNPARTRNKILIATFSLPSKVDNTIPNCPNIINKYTRMKPKMICFDFGDVKVAKRSLIGFP